ncbi:uncharacterized protein ALTATR162_LOCUS1394 [Alternaria atra]|uniref:Major facilitator superfamily (MFS) profile domain-containing protein n=1 Tax=Alternaria atra TaxID=119953 RepID=A0A8J2HWI4_9PLEO|nr:uncharacterized protein ALTATR162_LOCUS1394 [Alternaria atra]CAG5143662.1 unnamed protein product [Alternaria atra]
MTASARKIDEPYGTKEPSAQTVARDGEAPVSVLEDGSLDPVYEAKAKILNKAIQDIGMGRYQWQLFIVIGFGWAMDNLWPIVTSLIFTPVANEFSPTRPPLLSLSQNIGLLFGAVFWGFGCDIFGRRWAFNLTIGITAVFGMIAASSPNFAAIGTFAALWSVGVGGNLPVDSAIFLEFLPGSHQYLLTILSIHWALAQVFATLVAWPLLGNLTCQQTDTNCTRRQNMGWRYFMIVMGGVALMMFIGRFVFFTIFESPKFLMGKGNDSEAVRIVHEVARRNGKASSLTLEELEACNNYALPGTAQQNSTATAAVKRNLQKLDSSHVRALFATKKLAFSTSTITLVWAFIGLGYPLYNAYLPYIQATRGVDFGDGSTYITYRNSLIIAVLGVPGCILGGLLVEAPYIGRKGTLSLSTVLTGVFLLCSTTALNSNSLLGWNCAYNFMSNIMYAVLYAYTPEIFPTKDRGTGNAITASANRVFGIMAPIVAMFADLETSAPVYSALDALRSQYRSDKVAVLAGDMSDASLPEKAVALANEKWGRLDSLIINHGSLDPVKKVVDSTAEEWRKAFDVNVFSAVGLIQAALPSLRKTQGRILLTSSGAATSAYQGWGCYGAGKAVLNHLALTLSVEEPSVTTISIRPGVVDTEMQREIREVHHERMSENDREKFSGLKSSGGLLKPEQPGYVIARLAVGGEEVKGFNGKFLSWNDESLDKFQED